MVPITFLLADALDIDPIPLVLIEVFASNIGGTATLIGDPPNILIAGATDLSFIAFIVNLAPIVVVTLLVVISRCCTSLFRSRLQIAPEARERVMELDARPVDRGPRRAAPHAADPAPDDRGFFVHKPLHLEPATVALAGATIMLLVSRQSLEKALAGIEWPTLFFFIGLFVMVGALEETGAIQEVADGIASVTAGDRTAELLGILWVSGIASAVVDNIPFTATMIPVVEQLGRRRRSGVLVGAVARRLLRRQRDDHRAPPRTSPRRAWPSRAGRPIGFVPFLKVGDPCHARLARPLDRLRRPEVPVMTPATFVERGAPRGAAAAPRPVGRRGGRRRPGRGGARPAGRRRHASASSASSASASSSTRCSRATSTRSARRASSPSRSTACSSAALPAGAGAGRRPHDDRPRGDRRRPVRRPARGDLPAPPRARRARSSRTGG